MGLMRDSAGNYKVQGLVNDMEVLQAAADILRAQMERGVMIDGPTAATDFLRMRLGGLEREEFHVVWLDNRHRVITVECLFLGTIHGAHIHTREVVKAGLRVNAAACILAHNHPSGVADPSSADVAITKELIQALRLVDVRVIDHIIVTAGTSASMAQLGLL
jgi:DNA repair protein RadC